MGIVYIITCNETGKCYVGSTNKPIKVRIENHISMSKYPVKPLEKYNNKCESRHIISRGNWKYDILETNELTGLELKMKEQEYMDITDNPVNKRKAYISQEDIIERDRLIRIKYRQENREEINKRSKQWKKDNVCYTINCECGKSYQKRSEPRHLKTKTHSDYVLSLTH